MTAAVVMTIWVLAQGELEPDRPVHRGARRSRPRARPTSSRACSCRRRSTPCRSGLGLVLGTAGLPHILMRFFTVPDAKAARSSVMWAMVLIGAFYVMTTALGFGARAILGQGGEEAAGADRQRRAAAAGRRPRRRVVPGDHRRRRVRDDPGGRRRPGDLGLGRGRARRVVEHRPARAGLREARRSGSRRSPRS